MSISFMAIFLIYALSVIVFLFFFFWQEVFDSAEEEIYVHEKYYIQIHKCYKLTKIGITKKKNVVYYPC